MIKPIYSEFDFEANRWLFGLEKDDFEKVQAGYACGECLEDFQGEYKLVCPVCRASTAGGDKIILDTPSYWRR